MSRLTPDGYDKVGPVHPFVAWAGVMLVNLLGVTLGLTLILASADWIEDLFWPADQEVLPF